MPQSKTNGNGQSAIYIYKYANNNTCYMTGYLKIENFSGK